METKEYTYETRCRKCGNTSLWFLGISDEPRQMTLTIAHNKTIYPELLNCETCNQKTVQDTISIDIEEDV